MIGKIAGMGVYGGLARRDDAGSHHPALLVRSQIDGTPVLPGVMGIEAFAEAAHLCFPAGMSRRWKR